MTLKKTNDYKIYYMFLNKLAKELTNHSLPEIGESFGGRDHTTVLHACRRILELREEDSGIEEDYKKLVRALTA